MMNSKNDYKDKIQMSAKNKKIMTVILAVIFIAFAVKKSKHTVNIDTTYA